MIVRGLPRIVNWLWLAAILMVPTPATAQLNVITPNLRPLGYCQQTITTQVKFNTFCGFTGGVVSPGASLAVIIAENGGFRWRDDGVTPTASSGMFITSGTAPGNTLNYTGDLTQLWVVATPASSVLDISVYATH